MTDSPPRCLCQIADSPAFLLSIEYQHGTNDLFECEGMNVMNMNNGTCVLDLLADERFRVMLGELVRRSLSWQEFLELPMPGELSPAMTWEILNKVSESVGINLVIPDLEGNQYWYRRTFEITDIVNAIANACQTGSRLHRTVIASEGQHFIMRARVEEACAAAMLDGLAVSDEETRSLLRHDRAPQTPAERLIVNSFRVFDQLPTYVGERFSPELLTEFGKRLLDDVDMDSLQRGPVHLGLNIFDWENEAVEQHAAGQLEVICDYLNHDKGDERDHVVLRGMIAADALRFYRPLKEASSQVGHLAASLYALKHDLPVLALLPVSRAKIEWEEGRIIPPQVPYDRAAFLEQRRLSPGDLTAHHTMNAYLTLLTLQDVSSYIESWERRDAEMQEILRRDPELNQRQRSILSRALRNPRAEFRIRYHKTNHNIAYATARRDLMELEEKGYLQSTPRGKAFVFTPSPSLSDKVGVDA